MITCIATLELDLLEWVVSMYEWLIIIPFILGIFYLVSWLSGKRKRKKLLKNYDEKENKSRRTGLPRGKVVRDGNTEQSVARPPQPKGRELLPTTTVVSARKNRKTPRGIAGKLRR